MHVRQKLHTSYTCLACMASLPLMAVYDAEAQPTHDPG